MVNILFKRSRSIISAIALNESTIYFIIIVFCTNIDNVAQNIKIRSINICALDEFHEKFIFFKIKRNTSMKYTWRVNNIFSII